PRLLVSIPTRWAAPAYEHLRELVQNLWWCWDPDATSLFRELDPILWQSLDSNPVALLQQVPLGILAEDHIKSCSDLGIPVVGVGLYYDQGYFRQHIDQDGWQEEHYIDLDHHVLPLKLAVAAGVPVVVGIETQLGRITAPVWQLSVGR